MAYVMALWDAEDVQKDENNGLHEHHKVHALPANDLRVGDQEHRAILKLAAHENGQHFPHDPVVN